MYFTLEQATPFESSVLWQLHHSYFAQRGIEAWRQGDIPYFSTSNYAFARQHARYLCALVEDLERVGTLAPDAEVWVLEGGAGTGIFAANFLAALESGELGPKGLFERVRYLMTDYSEKNVRDALATPRIARFAELGVLVPARYDLTEPTRIHILNTAGGEGAPAYRPFVGRLTFAINNYICCVLPMRHLQKRADGHWYDLHVEVRVDVEDPTLATPQRYLEAMQRDATRNNLMRSFDIAWEWRAIELGAKLKDALHLRILERLVEGLGEVTVGYPDRYLDYLQGLRGLMVAGGAIMTNDYGSTQRTRLEGLQEWRPQYYGNTFNQDVNLSIFDAFAAECGWKLMRTEADLASVHTAVVSVEKAGPSAQAVFARHYRRLSESDDLLDFSNAARGYAQKKEPARALRFYLRCAELDPFNPEHRYRVGEAALEAGFYDIGVEHLKIGYELDRERVWDFEFQLGRSYVLLNDNPTALGWYERSAERAPHPVTHTNMGVILAGTGRNDEAYRCYKRALALDPDYERARECLNTLKEAIWESTTALYEKSAPA